MGFEVVSVLNTDSGVSSVCEIVSGVVSWAGSGDSSTFTSVETSVEGSGEVGGWGVGALGGTSGS